MNTRLMIIKFFSVLLMSSVLVGSLVSAQEDEAESTRVDHSADFRVSVNTDDVLEQRLAEMSPEALSEYMLKREEMRMAEEMNPFSASDSVPILVLLTVFGMPVLIIGLIVFFKYKRRKLLHETVRAMVEKGVEIPPHLFEEEAGQSHSAFRKGVVLIGVGLGLCAFFLFSGQGQGIGIGLIPLFIGGAYLVIWKLEGDNASSKQS